MVSFIKKYDSLLLYRRYLTQLGISEELRKSVNRRIKDGSDLNCELFTETQREVERIITDTTYPNFLKSDIYLEHVRTMQNGSRSVLVLQLKD